MTLNPFHLALPVIDLAASKEFYVKVLKCRPARFDERWLDLDFFGHQVSLHLSEDSESDVFNEVDGDKVPVRHFGIVLKWKEWHELKEHLVSLNIPFLIEPKIRFKGEPGQQATFFLKDPSGNAIEFKSFKSSKALFAT